VRETDAIAADGQGIAGKRVTMNIDRAREWHLQIVTRRWQLRRLPVLRIACAGVSLSGPGQCGHFSLPPRLQLRERARPYP